MTAVDTLLSALATGEARIIDLTAPLSPSTPVLQLPPPFANTIPLSLEKVSDFDDDGPFWGWNNIHTGEHTGTHLDAPVHWASGREGHSVDTIPPARLVGPAVVIDFTAEVAADPDFLLEPEHLEKHVADNGPFPEGAWLIFRTGWSARGGDPAAFANADDNGPHTPGRLPRRRAVARGVADLRLRRRDRRHRRRPGRRHGAGVPRALLPARRRQVRPHPAPERRPAPRHRRDGRRLPPADRGRHRLAGARPRDPPRLIPHRKAPP
ncbi:cyclase family protein [Nocardioides zeae]|uniref:Kynurenine formamidase n=1 Tax=Nocardioides zeae TaxID=1457234 RepID=A0AAJ1X0R4_9ACTN|nr:cyclase family protein [Nocardioides zeae]MDQ1104828.1 kynurenine formamidase [Nocardioides zeae]